MERNEFVQALMRMNKEKGMSAYSSSTNLKASLSDFASDAKGLAKQRTVFSNTMTAEVPQGGSLFSVVNRLSEFDAEKQKNWMRWLKDADIKEENVAFTIVCLLESFSLNNNIDKSLYSILGKGTGKISGKTSEKDDEVTDKQIKKTPARRRRKRRRRTALRIGGAVCIIAVIGVALFFAFKKSNEQSDAAFLVLKNAIQADDTQTITSSLADKAYGYKNADAVEKMVIDYASDQCEAFNNGTEDFNTAQDRIDSLRVGDFAGNADVTAKYELLDELSESKDSYKYAKEYKAKAKYENAIDYFGRVIEDDSNYKDAQDEIRECKEKYADEVLEQYETYMSSEDYEKAESVVSKALGSGLIDDSRVSTAQAEVQKIIGSIRDEYVEQTLNNVDSIYKENGVAAAVAALQTAYETTNDTRLKDEISKWQNRTSVVNLADVDPFYNNCMYMSTKTEEDNWGNNHNSHLYISDFRDNGYIEYNIKNIDEPKLQFTYYVPSHEASILPDGDKNWKNMTAKVYGDDVEIWSNNSAGQKMEPQLITLDVSNYSIIKICLTGENDSSMLSAWSCHIGDLQMCW